MDTRKFNYDQAYSFVTPNWLSAQNLKKIDQFNEENNETLIQFVENYLAQFSIERTSLLETGCGLGGLCHYFSSSFEYKTGIDISTLAITGAREIAKLKDHTGEFYTKDVTRGAQLDCHYSLIVDSHLLHCLTSDAERKSYFEFLKSHLTPDGHILIETMTFQKNLTPPNEYFFDENGILSKDDMPYRKISTSLELEEEFKQAGFKINYLYYHDELSFDVFTEYKNYPHDMLPKTLRVGLGL